MPAPKDPKRRELWLQNLSKATKGKKRPNTSIALKNSEKFQKRIKEHNKHMKHTEEFKEKQKIAAIKRKAYLNFGDCKGKNNGNFEKKHPGLNAGSNNPAYKLENNIPETRICACGCGQTFECMTVSKQKFIGYHSRRGKNNPMYVDGSSGKTYREFTKELKNKIHMRDNQKCVLCRKTRIDQILEQYLKDNKRIYELHAHHVDYDKTNCSESNLITLCHSCHPKTNTNRIYWQKLFTEGMGSSKSHGIIGV